MDDELYKDIEAYLGGDLSDEALMDFEKAMLENIDLKQEVTLYSQLNHHLGEQFINQDIPINEYTNKLREVIESDESEKIRERLNQANKEFAHNESRVSKRNFWIAASLALALFLGSTIYFTNKKPSLDDMYELYSQETPLPNIITRNDKQSKQYQIISMFDNGRYQESIDKFIEYEKSEKSIDTVLLIYKGMSYLELGETDAALKSFKIVSDSELLDSSKGLWFSVLTHLKNNNKEEVINSLEIIISNQSNYKYKKAKELYDKIK